MIRSLVHTQKGVRITIAILVLFHVIGTGIMLFYPEGAKLSYLNLLLAGSLLFLSESNYLKTSITLFIILIGGFVIEYIGVHTGLLFGNYTYGAALGPKIGEIPLVIGVNWFCIVLASSSLLFSLRVNSVIKAILAGALCTGLDFLIEPVAIKLDLIPVWNYICWFGFSSFFSFIYLSLTKSKNRPAQSLYLIWILFFSILNFAL